MFSKIKNFWLYKHERAILSLTAFLMIYVRFGLLISYL